ncbi:hypothetical protein GY45DRAFT_588622 [Cubamyces sp. BRFM 1775]|nr:hypothetical protein GY45DRAFT_588622 [Cubamyces sp. BRFM 1775]
MFSCLISAPIRSCSPRQHDVRRAGRMGSYVYYSHTSPLSAMIDAVCARRFTFVPERSRPLFSDQLTMGRSNSTLAPSVLLTLAALSIWGNELKRSWLCGVVLRLLHAAVHALQCRKIVLRVRLGVGVAKVGGRFESKDGTDKETHIIHAHLCSL